jgi:hypothetical protein
MSVCSIQNTKERQTRRSLGASHHGSLHVASQYSAFEPVLGRVINPPSRAIGGELGTDLAVFLQATRIKAPATVLTLLQLGVGCTHPKSTFQHHLNECYQMGQIMGKIYNMYKTDEAGGRSYRRMGSMKWL